MKRLVAIAAFALIATPVLAQDEDTCNAESHQIMIGQHRDALPDLPDGTRILTPNSRRTMEWLPERMNVELDEDEMVVQVTCG